MRIDFLSQFHQSTALAVYKLPSSRCCVILSTAISSSHWHLLQVISWCLPLSFWALEAATFIKSSSIAAQCTLPSQKRDFTSLKIMDTFICDWVKIDSGHPEDTLRENGLLRDTLCFLLFIKISIGLAEYKSHHEIRHLRVRFYWRRSEWPEFTGDPTCRQVRFDFCCALHWHYFFSLALFNI